MDLEFRCGFKQYIENELKNKTFIEVPIKEERKKYVVNVIVNNKYENIEMLKKFLYVS